MVRLGTIAILLLVGLLALPNAAGPTAVHIAGLDALLAGYAASEKLGFVALVAQGDEVVFQKAYGMAHRKQRLPNFVDTAFDIGSISKTFTAAAIYQLVDDTALASVHGGAAELLLVDLLTERRRHQRRACREQRGGRGRYHHVGEHGAQRSMARGGSEHQRQ